MLQPTIEKKIFIHEKNKWNGIFFVWWIKEEKDDHRTFVFWSNSSLSNSWIFLNEASSKDILLCKIVEYIQIKFSLISCIVIKSSSSQCQWNWETSDFRVKFTFSFTDSIAIKTSLKFYLNHLHFQEKKFE